MSVMVVSTTAMYHRRGYVGSPSMVDTGHKNNTVVSPGTYQVLGGSSATSTVGEIIDWSSSKSWILDFPTFALFRNILLKSITPKFHYWKHFRRTHSTRKGRFFVKNKFICNLFNITWSNMSCIFRVWNLNWIWIVKLFTSNFTRLIACIIHNTIFIQKTLKQNFITAILFKNWFFSYYLVENFGLLI